MGLLWIFVGFLFILRMTRGQIIYPDDSEHIRYMEQTTNFGPGFSSYPRYQPNPTAQKDTIITRGVLNLTLAIDRALASSKQGESDVVIYSPVGIASALALVLLGSNGKTFQEISSILGLDNGLDIEGSSQAVHEQIGRLLTQLQSNNNLDYGVRVNLATAIFLQDGFPIRPIYQEISKNVYKSDIINVDFSNHYSGSQSIINNWVKQKTNNKITNILATPPPTSTKVILVSALYFIGQWEKPFFEGLTKKKPFFPNGRKSRDSVLAEMMSNGGSFPYYRDRKLDCEILGFPYKGNKTTMYIVMPMQSNKEKLNTLEKQLTPSELERLFRSTTYQKAVVLFPKMKLESTVDLTNCLKQIGAKSLFNKAEANLALLSPGYGRSEVKPSQTQIKYASISSNNQHDFRDVLIFTRMDDVSRRTKRQGSYGRETIDSVRKSLNSSPYPENPGLYADQVIHKVYMEVTETGTEAAATTSVSISRGGDVVTFRVDHPFLFFIIDEDTKLVLFWGSVTTPTPSFT